MRVGGLLARELRKKLRSCPLPTPADISSLCWRQPTPCLPDNLPSISPTSQPGQARPERIWSFNLKQGGGLSGPRAVVELETQKFTGKVCSHAAGTRGESSRVIDASHWLGEGTWLFDIQAHTLPFSYQDGATTVNVPNEGGQLLYLRLSGS